MAATPTRWDLTAAVAELLERAGVPTPEVDARWLVDHVEERFGSLAACPRGVLDALVERRAAREPLQLVLGSTAFRHVTVACRAGVFVPRPETEVVAGRAIDAASTARTAPVVVEACTGSGAIALAVASEVPGSRLVAADASPAAVALARDNVDRLAAAPRPTPWRIGDWLAPGASVTVITSVLLDDVDPALRGAVDVLVANPPYVPRADLPTLPAEVAEHDPHDAVVGGDDGHEVVDALLELAPAWLRPGGTVVLEIDERREADAAAVARAAGLDDVQVRPDLAGRPRVLVARRPIRGRVSGGSTHDGLSSPLGGRVSGGSTHHD